MGGALAALLGARGVDVVVLERTAEPHGTPRAAHLDGEALRVLDAAGAPVTDLGRPLDGFDLVDRRGRLLLRGRPAEAPPPGFPAGVLVYQPDVERALRRRLGALPSVDVRLGHSVADVRDPKDGGGRQGGAVVVEGAGPRGPFAVEASVIVGCDGARSVVRDAMGAGLDGGRFEQAWLVVDAVLPRPALERLPDRLLQIADPARPTTYVPFPDPRRRWEFRLRPGERADDLERPEAVRALLAPHLADPDAAEIERAAVYTFHDLVARRWRAGRCVLAGDAAHQMPPFLGQGLGAGLRDAWALAPHVAAVWGGASPDALGAYEAERRPHVEATIRQAVRLGRLVTLPAPLAAVRDAVLRAGWRVPALRRRLLDVRG